MFYDNYGLTMVYYGLTMVYPTGLYDTYVRHSSLELNGLSKQFALAITYNWEGLHCRHIPWAHKCEEWDTPPSGAGYLQTTSVQRLWWMAVALWDHKPRKDKNNIKQLKDIANWLFYFFLRVAMLQFKHVIGKTPCLLMFVEPKETGISAACQE